MHRKAHAAEYLPAQPPLQCNRRRAAVGETGFEAVTGRLCNARRAAQTLPHRSFPPGGNMLCAHTVRRLKPGTFDEFAERFGPEEADAPAGWVRFHMLRSLADENEVVTFGFFDGTL